MTEEFDLIDLLERVREHYIPLRQVIDFTNPDMPVIEKEESALLHSYLMLHGEFVNYNGIFNTAKKFNKTVQQAESFKDFPEIQGLAARLKVARGSLEAAVRAIPEETVKELGYETKDIDGKLMLYSDDRE